MNKELTINHIHAESMMKISRCILSIALILTALTSCSTQKPLLSTKEGTYDYYSLKDALGVYLNKPVMIHIGDIAIECTISGLESDRIIIRQDDRVQEIPVRAISKIEMSDIRKSFAKSGVGSLLGGAIGLAIGKAGSAKLAKEWDKFDADDKQAAIIVASATAGFLAGAWIGSHKGIESLEINPNVEKLTLDRSVGESITETKRQQYGIFDDLPMQPTESMARIQVMQYGPTDYLIIYDSFEQPTLPKYAYDGREVTIKVPAAQMKLHWMPVSREYLVKQQDKIHQKLNKDGQELKYRLFQQ